MKRYTTSVARERLADILDDVESGERVVIERRGVRFSIETEPPPKARKRKTTSIIAAVDKDVEAGQWTWAWRPTGMAFTRRRS